ncbi:MAG: hypothetical protein A2428_16330 [Bdellovibrionales bacterium RIFOXYC1_FULL_54_43]|nr:MAG: hypothetical protein A2428_16330 [Bdellovibrionales bacterium RIFOXYC1_FULL_54_43]OFZ83966.1 MAG: hypothetical protein A2603_10465 [Bdellovibrionales bacterium RIFOXYD1_FULL_55_31]
MRAIPRINIQFTNGELFGFLFSLLGRARPESAAETIRLFEERFAAVVGHSRGVTFSKARVGFYLLLKNMGLKPGGEVVITALHVADFVNVIRCAGFKPVVVDLSPDTYSIDCEDLKRKIGPQTSLIYLTHYAGFPADMDRVLEIAREAGNIPIIEDCSQAVTTTYKGHPVGSFGSAAIYSLSLIKPVCTLFGGIVLSKDQALLSALRREQEKLAPAPSVPLAAEAVKNLILKMASNRSLFGAFVLPLLRMFAAHFDWLSKYQRSNKTVTLRERLPESYFTRFTWQQAALGLSQLASLKEREEARTRSASYIYEKLSSNGKFKRPRTLAGARNTFWLFPLFVEKPLPAKISLASSGVDSAGYLLSALHQEEAFKNYGFTAPGATRMKQHTLFVPVHGYLKQQELDAIVSSIQKLMKS